MSPARRPWYRTDLFALSLIMLVVVVLPSIAWQSWVFRLDPLSVLVGWVAVAVGVAVFALPFVAFLALGGAIGRRP